MSPQVFQNSAASYCLLDNVSVFLDRRGDKYHYLDREKTKLLDSLRQGFDDRQPSPDNSIPFAYNVIEELTEKNLLTTTAGNGKSLQPVVHESPRSSVYDNYWQRRTYPTAIAYLAYTYLSLQHRLKGESLFDTTQRAENLKAKVANAARDASLDDIAMRAKRLIDSRYFVYTYKDKCLFDSCLFFTHFIKQSVPVNWIFGVNLYPFAAHCWVEYKGLVLNDNLQRVAAFTPIYVV